MNAYDDWKWTVVLASNHILLQSNRGGFKPFGDMAFPERPGRPGGGIYNADQLSTADTIIK